MAGKYIIYKTNPETYETAVLFEPEIGHDDMFNMIRSKFPKTTVESAGFWDINNEGNIITYGRSVSLNIDSKPYDTTHINKNMLGNIVIPKEK